MSGTRARYTNFKIKINHNQTCEISCQKNEGFNLKEVNKLKWYIDHNYTMWFYLDHLPAGMKYVLKNGNSYTFYIGVPIGIVREDEYFLNNHLTFEIELHPQNSKYEIVSLNVFPSSINTKSLKDCLDYNENKEQLNYRFDYSSALLLEENVPITFTYDVIYKYSNETLKTRWDRYFRKGKVYHWMGMIFSNVIIFILTFIVFCILTRNINKDIELYNSRVINDEIIDEYGWKQVCNDVFRAPKNLIVLSACVGTGAELLVMLIISLFISVLGFFYPENRGNLLNYMIIIFCFLGIVNGYVSNFVYKNNGGKNWIKNTLISCILFPGVSIVILFFVRMLFSFEDSTIGLKLSEILLLIILWICISSPLTLLGSFLAINKKKIKFPCKINVLPTYIPKKPWFLKIKYVSFIAGLIPFGTIFIEFLYLLAYVWKYQVTYLASFLIFSIFFSVIITSEISIIFVYLNLCKGDYNWWWKSFFISASPGLYILGYSCYYLFHLNITRFSAILVYFVIMGEITMVACLICGSCGVLLTWAFLIMIYSKIKID